MNEYPRRKGTEMRTDNDSTSLVEQAWWENAAPHYADDRNPANIHVDEKGSITMECPLCHQKWEATPAALARHKGSGDCPACRRWGVRNRGRSRILSEQPWWPDVAPHYRGGIDPDATTCASKGKLVFACPTCGKEKAVGASSVFRAKHATECATCMSVRRHRKMGHVRPKLVDTEIWREHSDLYVADKSPDPESLPSGSARNITVRCAECGEEREIRTQNWANGQILCHGCASRKYWNERAAKKDRQGE